MRILVWFFDEATWPCNRFERVVDWGMGMGRLFKLALAAGLLLPTMANAEPVSLAAMTPGFTYFNRPGADLAAHNSAVAGCAVAALSTASVDRQLSGTAAGLLSYLVTAGLAAVADQATAASALENCMVVKGWRVVRLPEAEGKSLAAMDRASITAVMEPWIGAVQPHGDIVRAWRNDAADSDTIRFTIRPGKTANGHLSLKLVDPAASQPSPSPPPAKPEKVKLDPRWPTKGLSVRDFATVPADAAIILVDVRNVGMHNGIGLVFQRMGDDPAIAPSTIDHAPDVFSVFIGTLIAKKDGNIRAIAVPSGRWRIASMGLMPRLNFCLGSPAFEVKSGEIIYAGSFDMGSHALGPDLDLTAVKNWLAGSSAADRVTAASYVNGTLGRCGDNSIYALEIPGAPFEPGYQWGSAAQRQPDASVARQDPVPQ